MLFDEREFRRALGHFATGVAIVTARGADNTDIGLTITSFNSVSLEPPLVLFSIGRSAYSLPALQAASCYAVSILREDQKELSNRFAKAGADKWSGVTLRQGLSGCPIIHPALATFECEPFNTYDGGDHVIFVGKVQRFNADLHGTPLLFFRGHYSALPPQCVMP